VLVPAYRRQACKLWTKLFDFRSSATPSGHGVLPPCKYLLLNDWLPGFYLIPQYNATLNFLALFRPHPFESSGRPHATTPRHPGERKIPQPCEFAQATTSVKQAVTRYAVPATWSGPCRRPICCFRASVRIVEEQLI